MLKLTLREIRKGLGRYLAIVAIVALGVGVFCGLRLTKTAMVHTLDIYTQDQKMYHYRLISTLGFTDDDVAAMREDARVLEAEGGIGQDVICSMDAEQSLVLKAMILPQAINVPVLKAGHLPQEEGQCVVDSWVFTEDAIGKKIVLSKNNETDVLEGFSQTEFTVVGLVSSPLYINYERGGTALGKGVLDGYFYVLPQSFDLDYYTEVYLRLDGISGQVYSEQFDRSIEDAEAWVEALCQERADIRYETLYTEAREELDDARQTLDEKQLELSDAKITLADAEQKVADGQKEIADAKQELADAKKEIEDGWQEYHDGLIELQDGRKEIRDGEIELEDGWKEYYEAEKELEDGRKKLEDGREEFEDGQRELEDGWKQWGEGKREFHEKKQQALSLLDEARLQLEEQDAQLSEQEQNLAQQREQLDEQLRSLPDKDSVSEEQWAQIEPIYLQLMAADAALQSAQQELAGYRAALDAGWMQYYAQEHAAYDELEAAEEELLAAQKELLDAEEEISQAQEKLKESEEEFFDAEQQLDDAYQELIDAEKELEDAKQELADGEKEVADAKQQLLEAEQEVLDGEQELTDAQVELQDGIDEIEQAKEDLSEGEGKLLDAEEEYRDGEEKLSELELPQTYTLDRETNVGYVCFESDSDIVQGVSKIFPLFFFLVAALICITTMTRMVDEQRTQIGVLKAMGYSDTAIMATYFLYAASASLFGCVIGISLGAYLFPKIIWNAYNIMYGFTKILFAFDWPLALGSAGAYLLCALGATWIAIKKELALPASDLIRPKTPKAGKRILLERIGWIWNRVKFLHKVSIRNILRYKKRMFMMVIGIGGCTALLITGFGIRDSVQNVVGYQYEEIILHDGEIGFTEAMAEKDREAFVLQHADVLQQCVFVSQASMDCTANDAQKTAYVIVTEGDSVEGMIDFHNGDGAVLYPQAGQCIMSDALARVLSLNVGDTVTVHDSSMHEMRLIVGGIFENYVSHYVYIPVETYTQQMGAAPEYKNAWFTVSDQQDLHAAAASLMEDDLVSSASVNLDLRERMDTMMQSLEYIVLVIVICAGALAFIVLYNLTNINITERAREIATVKVLGFFERETNWYIYRENLILIVLGAIAGVPMGVGLHAYVMAQVKIDMISFDVRIAPMSFVYAIVLTIVFGLIVNVVLSEKIRRIHMAQALKSIE